MKLRIRISFFLLFAVASVNGINYLDEMRLFVMKLAQLGRQTNRNLIVIPQNGVPMMTVNGRPNGNLSEEFLRTINGWGQEDLFYGAENDNQATPQEATNELNSFFNRLIVGRWPIKVDSHDKKKA